MKVIDITSISWILEAISVVSFLMKMCTPLWSFYEKQILKIVFMRRLEICAFNIFAVITIVNSMSVVYTIIMAINV